jgi:hypothetical protein
VRLSHKKIFTPSAYDRLIRCAVQGGASRQQINWFIAQCEQTRVKADLLKVLLSGGACVSDITEQTFAARIPPP